MSKAKQQKSHARHRCYQRYGVRLTQEMHTNWVRMIQESHYLTKLVDKQSNRVSVYRVPMPLPHKPVTGDKPIPDPFRPQPIQYVYVVYDRNRKNIVTVLPAEYEPPKRRPE